MTRAEWIVSARFRSQLELKIRELHLELRETRLRIEALAADEAAAERLLASERISEATADGAEGPDAVDPSGAIRREGDPTRV